MNTEQSNSRNSGTTLGRPSCCLHLPRQSAFHHSNPKQHSIRGNADRDIGLFLYEILAMADQMRESYGDGNLESLGNRLSLLMAKSENFASFLAVVIELAKREAAAMDAAAEVFDIHELLLETSRTTRLIIGSKPVKIIVASHPLPLFVHADRAKIRQIMMEIMSNAAKFTSRGRIAVIINKDDDRVRMTVTDTGRGMTSGQLSAFFPSPGPDNADELNGLSRTGHGFKTTRSLVALLKGSMIVSSKLGEGTIVEISLPIGQTKGTDTANNMMRKENATVRAVP